MLPQEIKSSPKLPKFRLISMGKIIYYIFFFFFVYTAKSQAVLQGTATNVYDGDTFTLVTSGDEKIKIRVVGIDAPEANQEYGINSRDYARAILDQKKVTVYLEPGETYGRKLGVVVTEDGIHFNYQMVATGNAWWYDYYSDDKYLEAAMKEAQINQKGLWSKSNPIAPWEWRKLNK